MPKQSLQISLIVAKQIISDIILRSLNQQFTANLLLTGNPFCKQFYSSFVNQNLKQTIFSSILAKNQQATQQFKKPTDFLNIDEEPQFIDNLKRKLSLSSSKTLAKTSIKKINFKSLKSVKTIKNDDKKSKKLLESKKQITNQERKKKLPYIRLNSKQRTKLLIKLKSQTQINKQKSIDEIQKIHDEMRRNLSQQKIKETKFRKTLSNFKSAKNGNNIQQYNENFPLLENINTVQYKILVKNQRNTNKKETLLDSKIDKSILHENNIQREKVLTISKSSQKRQNLQDFSNMNLRSHNCHSLDNSKILNFSRNSSIISSKLSRINLKQSNQNLNLENDIRISRQKSLTYLGARQRRSSHLNIQYEAAHKINQCKTKNILKIQNSDQNQMQKKQTIKKNKNQKLVIKNKEALNFLLNSNQNKLLSMTSFENVPKANTQNTNKMAIKLI